MMRINNIQLFVREKSKSKTDATTPTKRDQSPAKERVVFKDNQPSLQLAHWLGAKTATIQFN